MNSFENPKVTWQENRYYTFLCCEGHLVGLKSDSTGLFNIVKFFLIFHICQKMLKNY